MTVSDLYRVIDSIAPFDTQEEYDNSGFLVGDPAQEVSCILMALDVTPAVVDEAVECGAQLIITHHPLLFTPARRLTEEDYEGRLIRRLTRENISLISAHTNLDQAPGGINDTLAELCGLSNVQGEGFFRFGDLPEALPAADCAAFLSERLGDSVRLMGPAGAPAGSACAAAAEAANGRRPRRPAATPSSAAKSSTTTRWRWPKAASLLSNAGISPPSSRGCPSWPPLYKTRCVR